MIQLGTDLTSHNGEQPTPYAFIEEYVPTTMKDYQVTIQLSNGHGNVPLTQGAHVAAIFFPSSGNQWHWEIRDYGKSGTTQIGIADFLWTPPIRATADSAEVIHEVSPPINKGGVVLPTTPITFTNGQVLFKAPATNVVWHSDYIGSAAHRLGMPSQPSVEANDQFEFDLRRWVEGSAATDALKRTRGCRQPHPRSY